MWLLQQAVPPPNTLLLPCHLFDAAAERRGGYQKRKGEKETTRGRDKERKEERRKEGKRKGKEERKQERKKERQKARGKGNVQSRLSAKVVGKRLTSRLKWPRSCTKAGGWCSPLQVVLEPTMVACSCGTKSARLLLVTLPAGMLL